MAKNPMQSTVRPGDVWTFVTPAKVVTRDVKTSGLVTITVVTYDDGAVVTLVNDGPSLHFDCNRAMTIDEDRKMVTIHPPDPVS